MGGLKQWNIKKTINVNELVNILKKHYRLKNVFITEIAVANIINQYKPVVLKVGSGGCLFISFDTSRKLK